MAKQHTALKALMCCLNVPIQWFTWKNSRSTCEALLSLMQLVEMCLLCLGCSQFYRGSSSQTPVICNFSNHCSFFSFFFMASLSKIREMPYKEFKVASCHLSSLTLLLQRQNVHAVHLLSISVLYCLSMCNTNIWFAVYICHWLLDVLCLF